MFFFFVGCLFGYLCFVRRLLARSNGNRHCDDGRAKNTNTQQKNEDEEKNAHSAHRQITAA